MAELKPAEIMYVWRFAAAEFDEASLELRVGGHNVDMEPRPLEVLLHLLRHAGQVVTKGDLLDAVYGHRHLSDGALAQAIRRLRRALLDDGQGIIETIHRVGYKFVADVQRVEIVGPRLSPAPVQPAAMPEAGGPERIVSSRFVGKPLTWAAGLTALAILLTGSQIASQANHPPPDASSPISQANDAYLHALVLLRRRHTNLDAWQELTGSLRLAVSLDPKFASAWALLAQESAHLVFNHKDSEANRIESRHALDQALRLQPDAPDTLIAEGYYEYWVDADYDAARRVMQRVYAQWPNRNEATIALAEIARREGGYAESALYLQHALTLDKVNVELALQLADVRLALQQFDAALKAVNFALDISPLDIQAIGIKANIYQQRGDFKQAGVVLAPLAVKLDEFDAVRLMAEQARLQRDFASGIALWRHYLASHTTDDANTSLARMDLGHLLLISGDKTAANPLLQSARQGLERARAGQPSDPRPVGDLSLICADLGEIELATTLANSTVAFEVVRHDATRLAYFQAIQARVNARTRNNDDGFAVLNHLLRAPFVFNFAPGLLAVDPEWDELRADPRFEELLRTVVSRREESLQANASRT